MGSDFGNNREETFFPSVAYVGEHDQWKTPGFDVVSGLFEDDDIPKYPTIFGDK